jgi:hypothetical protein
VKVDYQLKNIKIKRASKLISNKRKPKMTHNLPTWIFKVPTIYMM